MVKRRIEAIAHGAFRLTGRSDRGDEDDGPHLAPWRSNLTALSQECNLYFVACGEEVHVHEPRRGPEGTQLLDHTPALIVRCEPSARGLQGYLDEGRPHAINNILVAMLGREEVLASVRDDGDCDVFLIRQIIHALDESRDGLYQQRDLIPIFERPIYQTNVGISAWGLAIHQKARILAISSNIHEVTIVRFALVDEADPGQPDDKLRHLEDDTNLLLLDRSLRQQPGACHPEESARRQQAEPERRTDVTLQIMNGESNIPHIAFCNTGDDPTGRWLATTDISGKCAILDLHLSTCVQAMRFAPASRYNFSDYDRETAGWGIMFLDRRSFHLEAILHEALGMERHTSTLPNDFIDRPVWDLSQTLQNLEGMPYAFVDTTGEERRDGADRRYRIPNDWLMPSATGNTNFENGDEDDDDNDDDNDDNDDNVDDEDDDDVIMRTERDRREANTSRIDSPRFKRNTSICDDLPCPILHTSVRDIYLLQPSRRHTNQIGPFTPPLVGLVNPLGQGTQYRYGGLFQFDRMNMHAYIPSLGVVIVASQMGRAIVLALTKVRKDARTKYAMRAECVIPFASQEQGPTDQQPGERPFMPLHGIAIGPMPGTERLKDDEKRWRLFMMYQDSTILSYEIRRKEDLGIGVANVVV